MIKEEKMNLIDRYEKASGEFDDVIKLPQALVDYRPFPDAWTIREQVIHCLDVDVASFHRYRWGIISPGTKVLSFDRQWTERLNYQSADTALALDLIRAVRRFMAAHLRAIAGQDWSGYYYFLGDEKRLNLEEALRLFVDHVAFHRELIDRNIYLFGKMKS